MVARPHVPEYSFMDLSPQFPRAHSPTAEIICTSKNETKENIDMLHEQQPAITLSVVYWYRIWYALEIELKRVKRAYGARNYTTIYEFMPLIVLLTAP